MSPQSGTILLEQIAPRLRAVIPKAVKTVGAGDTEELLQDAMTIAAQMLHRVEETGKKVTPGNIAYYVILHMKSGRRSQSATRTDVMAPGTQLDDKSCVLSFEEEVGYDPELDAPITLGELLASEHEDPSQAGARNLDWELFLSTHDYRYGVILKGMAEGRSLKDTAAAQNEWYPGMRALKNRMAEEVREYMGEEAIAESVRTPRWKASIAVDREKTACRSERKARTQRGSR